MESFRSSLTDMYTGEKIKITPLAFIIKALVASLKKFPSFNSSIDEIETGKMTLKKYYHCLLYTSPSPRDPKTSRMPSSA